MFFGGTQCTITIYLLNNTVIVCFMTFVKLSHFEV